MNLPFHAGSLHAALLAAALLLLLVLRAAWRASRISRAELRALKELASSSGLLFHRATLLRNPRLIGKWHGSATALVLGQNGLRITMRLKAKAERRTAVLCPGRKNSPTWGISDYLESTYHVTGDRQLLERLAGGVEQLDAVRHLSGEFKLTVAPRSRGTARLTFQTAIAVGSAEQIRRLLDALLALSRRLENGNG